MAMKIGTEDKKKVAIAAGLGVAVLGLVIYNLISFFGGSSTPAPAPAAPQAPVATTAPASPSRPAGPSATRQRVIPSRAHEATKISGTMAGLDPTLHPEIMEQAESIEYTG
jgi:predicted lipid-binding transport protein (Tim44 family)